MLGALLAGLCLFIMAVNGYVAPYFVKIQYPLPSDPFLNLAEVTAFTGKSTVSPSDCTLSSVWSDYDGPSYPGSLCCDGDFSNYCASQSDVNAYLIITYPTSFASLLVTNRITDSERILGATITIFDSSDSVIYQSSFTSLENSYTFSGFSFTSAPSIAPTTNPTAVPTLEPSAAPSALPTSDPSVEPSAAPTAAPIPAPTAAPIPAPTAAPTAAPTVEPSPTPSVAPIADTIIPTMLPTPKGGVLGVDYGRAVLLSNTSLSCLRNDVGIHFIVPRGYSTVRSAGDGVHSKVDANVCKHLRMGTNARMAVRGVYVLARPLEGLPSHLPMQELLRKLLDDCPEYVSYHRYFKSKFRVWIGVNLHSGFENNGWFSDTNRNRRWFEALLASCKRYFSVDHCGVLTSAEAWVSIFGNQGFWNATAMEGLGLWYTLPSNGGANFKDYRQGNIQIGEWTTPLMKQHRSPSEICGVRVGLNWALE